MNNPKPENIDGMKSVQTAYSHEFDWGQISLGLAFIVAAVVAYKIWSDAKAGEGSEEIDGAPVEIGAEADVVGGVPTG